MSAEKMLVEFKVWAMKASFPLDLRDDGQFLYTETRNAWWGWRGHQESLEIGLPAEDLNIDYTGYISKQDTVVLIESLGLKVKP